MKKITERKVKYQGISLPKNLLDMIKNYIDQDKTKYTSVTDFVKYAVREQLDKETNKI